MRASYHFANEAELSRRNHILDAWDVVEHLTHFLVSYLSLFDIAHREVEYPPNILMEKNFKLTEERLSQDQFLHPHNRRFTEIAQKRRYLP